jgi:23S rRNA pseudouridine955/2504/2580 synthase
MSGVETVPVTADEADLRLDRWFKRRYPTLTHGRLEKLLRTGQVRVDGKRAKADLRVQPGARVRVPPGVDAPPPVERPTVAPADVALIRSLVIHRDDDVIALAKPHGLAVQGGSDTPRHLDGMLDALSQPGGERPRLVHRLDRDTSGVLVLAAHARAAARLGEAFRDKTTRKIYWALVVGAPNPASGRIDTKLAKQAGRHGERVALAGEDGQRAITDYVTVENAGNRLAWVVFMPVTGRTHQLRVHAAEVLGTPIVGDTKYGGARAMVGGDIASKLHLHARAVELPHPAGGTLRLVAPLPPHMLATWRLFGLDPDVDPFAR